VAPCDARLALRRRGSPASDSGPVAGVLQPAGGTDGGAVIPSSDLRRVLERISALGSDPRPPGCQKLSAQERYRIRCGRYRVVYEIRDRELVVLAVEVAQRKDV